MSSKEKEVMESANMISLECLRIMEEAHELDRFSPTGGMIGLLIAVLAYIKSAPDEVQERPDLVKLKEEIETFLSPMLAAIGCDILHFNRSSLRSIQ